MLLEYIFKKSNKVIFWVKVKLEEHCEMFFVTFK